MNFLLSKCLVLCCGIIAVITCPFHTLIYYYSFSFSSFWSIHAAFSHHHHHFSPFLMPSRAIAVPQFPQTSLHKPKGYHKNTESTRSNATYILLQSSYKYKTLFYETDQIYLNINLNIFCYTHFFFLNIHLGF